MSIKVNDSKNVGTAGKKKVNKSSANTGVSFDDLVSAASTEAEVSAVEPVPGATGVRAGVSAPVFYSGDETPTEPKARGNHILKLLEELQKDVLAGQATQAVEKLKKALASGAVKQAELPKALQSVLDEIDLRASIEVAKMEESQ